MPAQETYAPRTALGRPRRRLNAGEYAGIVPWGTKHPPNQSSVPACMAVQERKTAVGAPSKSERPG